LKKALTQSNESDKEGDDEGIDEAVLDDLNRRDEEIISRYKTKKITHNPPTLPFLLDGIQRRTDLLRWAQPD